MIDLDKFITIEKELAQENGSFDLFALFLREDSIGKWDILVASDWLQKDQRKSMRLITKKLRDQLSKNELINVSRVVIISEDNPGFDDFSQAIDSEDEVTEVKNTIFFGLPIKHAFVITSKRTNQIEHAHNNS